MRQRLNYCVDRDGVVTLLNGTAEPAVGWLKPSDPNFGDSKSRYTASRQPPDSPSLHGAVELNVSSPSSDVGVMARYSAARSFSPVGFNSEHWTDEAFEVVLGRLALANDPAEIRIAHKRMVDNLPWFYVVYDLNSRAMSKRIQGFTLVQSWFLDLTAISLRP